MSIFDKDIKIPVDHLYDECKDVCGYIVPMNMMHYNAGEEDMKKDIIKELKYRGLFHELYPYEHEALYKICDVEVSKLDYVRLIPRYRVWFHYISKEMETPSGDMILMSSYLTDFIVSINGVESNGPV